VPDPRGRLLRAALGFAGLPRPSHDRALWALRIWLDSWSGIGRIAVGMHLRPPVDSVRRARLARNVLQEWDGALADERDRHRMGADAVARDAASGWEALTPK